MVFRTALENAAQKTPLPEPRGWALPVSSTMVTYVSTALALNTMHFTHRVLHIISKKTKPYLLYNINTFGTWDYHSSVAEDTRLLGCDAVPSYKDSLTRL